MIRYGFAAVPVVVVACSAPAEDTGAVEAVTGTEGRADKWTKARVQVANLEKGGYSAVTKADDDLFLIRGQVFDYVLDSDPELPFDRFRFDWSAFDE